MATKICHRCNIEQAITEFHKKTESKDGHAGICKSCSKKKGQKYYQENKDEMDKKHKEYNERHKEEITQYHKEHSEAYHEKHREEINKRHIEHNKAHREIAANNYQKNKQAINKKRQQRRREDQAFRLRTYVSTTVGQTLKSRGRRKNARTWSSLPYTPDELDKHLQSLFSHPDNLTPNGEIWMTKDNQGKYDPKTWDDNDPATWKWQLDHIIPHSTFEYDDLNDPRFRECWALSNLRPLSAKKNQHDGATKARHKKK